MLDEVNEMLVGERHARCNGVSLFWNRLQRWKRRRLWFDLAAGLVAPLYFMGPR